jgi:hypothetical protein
LRGSSPSASRSRTDLSIKVSSAAEIRVLVDALSAPDDTRREAAVARLGIIGARAVDRLTSAYKAADRPTRIAILRALERIGDDRSLAPAREALTGGGDLAIAATGVLRAVLPSRHAETAAAALEALVAACLNPGNERGLRLAAFDALQDMPDDVKERVKAALDADGSAGIGELVTGKDDGETARAEAVWKDAIEGRLPESPRALRDALGPRAGSAPLNRLRALVDAVREREEAENAAGWLALRGALHQALALRGSRVALYDLRETIDACPPALPASFLTAFHAIGDASCLEPLASAWGAAADNATPEGERWRQQLAAAFAAIVAREKISKRHPALKRVAAKWPGLT